MEGTTLQFHGTSATLLYVAVLGAISLALLVHGAVRLLTGLRRLGIMSIAAAFGMTAPALLIDGAIRHARHLRRDAAFPARIASVIATACVIAWIAIFHASPERWIPALLVFHVGFAIGVFYAAVYSHLGTSRLATLMVLRILAVLALVFLLFKPVLRTIPQGLLKPVLPVLVDRSGSMSSQDGNLEANRYHRAVRELLTQRSRLAERFELPWYTFGDDLKTAESLDELHALNPQSESTDIAAAIEEVSAEYQAADLAGMLILSDGVHNASGSLSDVAKRSPAPIYATAVGSADENALGQPDARIASVEAPFRASLNHTSRIPVRIGAEKLMNRSLAVTLENVETGELLDQKIVDVRKPQEELRTELKWTPQRRESRFDGADVRELALQIETLSIDSKPLNNSHNMHVLIRQPRIRVLYLEGSIRSEYKFLRRRLDSDPNLQLMAMIRMSENRFWSYGSLEGKKLQRLPSTDEDFDLFDVLMIGDLDASFLTRDQMTKIQQFVNDGGGLVMIGGQNTFGPGGYAGTEIQRVLPVIVGDRNQPQESTAFIPQLTSAGGRHPIFDGIDGYFLSPGRSEPEIADPRLPLLQGCVTVAKPKAFATVLAVHPTRENQSGPLTVLAVQSYGAGRTAAFTADTTWKWYMPLRTLGEQSPYGRFWSQLVRWSAGADSADESEHPALILRTDRGAITRGDSVELDVLLAGEERKPLRNAKLSCELRNADGQSVQQFALRPDASNRRFTASIIPKQSGKFTLRASAEFGERTISDELPMVVLEHSEEMQRLARNDRALSDLAGNSNGAMETLDRLPELIDRILEANRNRMREGKPTTVRLYHFPALFVIVVILLTLEWLLRRRWRLQ